MHTLILKVLNKESQWEPTRDYLDKRTRYRRRYIYVVAIFICGVGVGISMISAMISVFLEGNPEGPRLEPRLKSFGSKHRHFSHPISRANHLRRVFRTA